MFRAKLDRIAMRQPVNDDRDALQDATIAILGKQLVDLYQHSLTDAPGYRLDQFENELYGIAYRQGPTIRQLRDLELARVLATTLVHVGQSPRHTQTPFNATRISRFAISTSSIKSK
jgi:hypothetical protein